MYFDRGTLGGECGIGRVQQKPPRTVVRKGREESESEQRRRLLRG